MDGISEEEGGRKCRAFGGLGGIAVGAERGEELEFTAVCGERWPPEEGRGGRMHLGRPFGIGFPSIARWKVLRFRVV